MKFKVPAPLYLSFEPGASLCNRPGFCTLSHSKVPTKQGMSGQRTKERMLDPKLTPKISQSFICFNFVNTSPQPPFSIPEVPSQTVNVSSGIQERESGAHQALEDPGQDRVYFLPHFPFCFSQDHSFHTDASPFLCKEKCAWLPWRCHERFTKESLGFTLEV